MKKQLISILLLLSLLCCVACQRDVTDTSSVPDDKSDTLNDTSNIPNDTSSTPPQEDDEPTEFEPQLYVPYAYRQHFPYNSDFSFDALSIEGVNVHLPSWEGEGILTAREENIPNIVWEWDGLRLDCYYNWSGQCSFGGIGRQDLTREYKIVGNRGTIGYDIATGDWVWADFRRSDFIDANPSAEKLTKEECEAIAQRHIQNYVATVSADINLEQYTYRKIDLQTDTNGRNYYTFIYERYIDGALTEDTIICCITEYGSMDFFHRGDNFKPFEEIKDTIDNDQIVANLKHTAELICAQATDINMTYSFGNSHIKKLHDGSYILDITIYFAFVHNDIQKAGSVCVKMLIT